MLTNVKIFKMLSIFYFYICYIYVVKNMKVKIMIRKIGNFIIPTAIISQKQQISFGKNKNKETTGAEVMGKAASVLIKETQTLYTRHAKAPIGASLEEWLAYRIEENEFVIKFLKEKGQEIANKAKKIKAPIIRLIREK